MAKMNHEKLNRKKRVKKPNKYLITSRYSGICCLCNKPYETNKAVWFYPNNPAGKKIEHKLCWKGS